MAKRTDTRDRMLQTAGDLLHRQGYTATGLNQILEESRAPKGSLYFHFPGGKEELMSLALERTSASLTEMLERILETAPGGEQALEAITAYFAGQLESSRFTKGCPLATVALEQAATSDALHRVCSATYARWQASIAARLERDGFPRERAESLAGLFLSTIEGALLLCRAHRSTEPLLRASAELRRTLKGTP
jgi:TetR/AcrR family transcriptional repressor of lmrAB and yxaGH operons